MKDHMAECVDRVTHSFTGDCGKGVGGATQVECCSEGWTRMWLLGLEEGQRHHRKLPVWLSLAVLVHSSPATSMNNES